MKTNKKQFILTAIILLLSAVLVSPPLVYAQSDDTDGTEIQVLQPEQLEIQLGTDWAGVEFWLRTDNGMYPDPIPVGQVMKSRNNSMRCHQNSTPTKNDA